jgi:hypothetical protein
MGPSGDGRRSDPSKRDEQHAFRVRGGENRPKPKVTEVLRERVEAELEDWLRPFYAARDGDDPQLALKAAESVLDRVYGRPKQTSEISGPDGSAITIDSIAYAARRRLQAV